MQYHPLPRPGELRLRVMPESRKYGRRHRRLLRFLHLSPRIFFFRPALLLRPMAPRLGRTGGRVGRGHRHRGEFAIVRKSRTRGLITVIRGCISLPSTAPSIKGRLEISNVDCAVVVPRAFVFLQIWTRGRRIACFFVLGCKTLVHANSSYVCDGDGLPKFRLRDTSAVSLSPSC